MNIHYRNKKIERLCTDLPYAKKEINRYSEKLHSLINFIENAMNLNDVAMMQMLSISRFPQVYIGKKINKKVLIYSNRFQTLVVKHKTLMTKLGMS